MKPVMQKKLVLDGHYDAFEACVASLLEITLDEVPYLAGASPRVTTEFLAKYNLACVWIDTQAETGGTVKFNYVGGDGYCVMIGHSPLDKAKYHCVVAKPVGHIPAIIHDPHPEKIGIHGLPTAIYLIVPLSCRAKLGGV